MINELSRYGINVKPGARGDVKTTCPKCSHTRKHKNDPCLSVNVDDGVWNCWNCSWSGTVKKRKEYTKPSSELKNLSEPVIKWFADRGISNQTLLRYKITESTEYMPQVEKEVRCINFNYFYENELVNIKYRDSAKNFKLVSGAMLSLYGLDVCLDNSDTEIGIVEGECFDDKAMILTDSGWKLFSDLTFDDKVAQYDKGYIEFVKPINHVRKKYTGNLLQFTNSRGNFYSLTTPEHNLYSTIGKVKACDVKYQTDIIRNGIIDGPGIPLSDDEIRLYIAISADLSIRNGGDIYGSFKRQRKISRLSSILDNLNLKYTTTSSKGCTSFFIHRHQNLTPFKKFPIDWLINMNKHQRELFVEELVHWDGNRVPNRTMTEYSSKYIENAEFVQSMCHTIGMMSTIVKRKNSLGEWFKVTMLRKKTSTVSEKYKTLIPYNGFVYCVTVPSGAILVKQNGNITVSGNCDVLAMYEAGIKYFVSVPNGASKGNQKLEWLDDLYHVFEGKRIYLATDMDEPGISLRNELARRLGKQNCWIVELPEKDANETLLKHGSKALIKAINTATPFPVEGLEDANSKSGDLLALYDQGFPEGYETGWDMDESFKIFPGQATLVTGIPGSGKTTWLKNLLSKLSRNHDLVNLIYSAEEANTEYALADILSITLNKPFFNVPGHQRITKEEVEYWTPWLATHFKYYKLNEDVLTIESILSKAEEMVKRFGINVLVIDNLSTVERSMSKNSDNRHYAIGEMWGDIVKFARNYGVHVFVVAHPKKMAKINGKYEVPTGYDVGDSSYHYNKPDNGLTVHRNRETGQTEVHRWKVRFRYTGQEGVDYFKFNLATNVFTSAEKLNDGSDKTKFKGQPLSKAEFARLAGLNAPGV